MQTETLSNNCYFILSLDFGINRGNGVYEEKSLYPLSLRTLSAVGFNLINKIYFFPQKNREQGTRDE